MERSHLHVLSLILAGSGRRIVFDAIDESLQFPSSLKCVFDDGHSFRSYGFDAHDVVYQFFLHTQTYANSESKKSAEERGDAQQSEPTISKRSMSQSEEN